MGIPDLINRDAIVSFINDEVDKLTLIKIEEFRKELSQNYYFDDCLLNREAVALKLDISLRQVDTLVKTKRLKKCSIGRSVKFRNSDILEYIATLK